MYLFSLMLLTVMLKYFELQQFMYDPILLDKVLKDHRKLCFKSQIFI